MMQESFSLLVVEDNPDDVTLLRAMLADVSSIRFSLSIAGTLSDALDALGSETFDAMVIDLNLPDSQGLETFHTLRKASSRIPIIVATVLDLEEVALEAVRSGAQDYLVKDQMTGLLIAKAVRYGIQRMETRAKLEQAKKQLEERVEEQVAVIRANEERYRAMFEHMASAAAVFEAIEDGADFIIKEFNPAAERIERISRVDVIGKKVTEVFPGVEEFGLLEVFRQVGETGEPQDYPASYYKDSRVEGWRENSVYKLPTGELVAVYDDVTDKKKAEAALADLARFTSESPNPILRVDDAGCVLYANLPGEAFLDLFQTEKAGFLPKELIDLSGGCLESGSECNSEFQVEERTFQIYLSPVPERRYVNIYCLDTTERSLAEREVRHQLRINLALSRLYPPLVTTSDISEISQIVFDEARQLTDSEHGYVGSLDDNGDLMVHFLSVMLEYDCTVQEERHRTTRFSPGEDGAFPALYGIALNTKKPFYTNDAAKHPGYKGVPEGHIEISRFLSVPVMLGEELVGQIAVANKGEEYDAEDLAAVERLAEYYALAIKKERDDRNLRQLSAAVEQSPASVVITDLSGTIEYVNPKFTEITGYSWEEAVGRNPRILQSGRQDANIYKDLWGTILQGEVWVGELCNRNKDGEEFWEFASISPIRNSRGEITHFLGVKEDITRRKLAEMQLRESERKYRTLYESMHDGFFATDLDGRFTEANPAFLSMLGYDFKTLQEMSIRDVTPQHETEQSQAQIYEQILQRGYSDLFDEDLVCKKGDIVSASLRMHLITDVAGVPTGLWAVVRDVTERRRAEELTKEYAQLLHAVLEGIQAAILIVNMEDHHIVEANSIAQEILETPESEILGSDCRTHLDMDDNFHPCDGMTDPVINHETMLNRPDGTKVPVMRSILPVTLQGKPHVVETLFNLTERRKLEAQLVQAQKLESIGQLAAGIAHEINTPTQYVDNNLQFLKNSYTDVMTILNEYASLLECSGNWDAMAQKAEQVEKAVKELELDFLMEDIPQALDESLEGLHRIAEIVRSVKQFSHLGDASREVVNINESVQSTITVSKNEWKYDADLTTSLDESIPRIPCYISEFNQVLLNLIINATHAIQERIESGDKARGCIDVSTSAEDDWVVIRVSDNGTGIPEEHREHLFDPFFTTKKVGRGTGQGLAISYSIIVEKHGGQILFDTEVGKGTTFTVMLPMHGKNGGTQE